jgi:hypothetical protein
MLGFLDLENVFGIFYSVSVEQAIQDFYAVELMLMVIVLPRWEDLG